MYREPATPRAAIELRPLSRRPWWRADDEATLAFLGERAFVRARAYVSLDGARRVRFSPTDPEARLETLDVARGITLRSERRSVALQRPGLGPRAPVARWYAPVLGRCVRPVCHAASRVVEPRMVRLLAFDDGVCIVRLDTEGAEVGDTWHARSRDALRQLEYELGPHVGRLRWGDGAKPWRRAEAWAASGARDTQTF